MNKNGVQVVEVTMHADSSKCSHQRQLTRTKNSESNHVQMQQRWDARSPPRWLVYSVMGSSKVTGMQWDCSHHGNYNVACVHAHQIKVPSKQSAERWWCLVIDTLPASLSKTWYFETVCVSQDGWDSTCLGWLRSTCVCVCEYVDICTCTYMYIWPWVYVCMYVCVHLSVFLSVYVSVSELQHVNGFNSTYSWGG